MAPLFNDKPYSSVNREERFFCALLAHALLMSTEVRGRFVRLIGSRRAVTLDPADLQVFLEAAVLRDYWNDLGDAKSYSTPTHERRLELVRELLRSVDVDPALVEQHHLFWSIGIGNSKIHSPGRWHLPKRDFGELGQASVHKLQRLKWAFNSKPDLLLLSPAGALLLEAKVESTEGVYRSADGEAPLANATIARQRDVQRLVANVMQRFVPAFRQVPIVTATLGLRGHTEQVAGRTPTHDITWAEVAALCDVDSVDAFTRNCLIELRRYAPAPSASA